MFREVNLPSHMVVELMSKHLSDSKVHAFNCNTASLRFYSVVSFLGLIYLF